MRRRETWKSVVLNGILPFIVLALPADSDAHVVEGPTFYTITDLGTLGGASSAAEAISQSGHVAGWSNTAGGDRHAFLFDDGVMLDLGTLEGGTRSRATGVNQNGQVVGDSGINEHGPMFEEFTQAFLWQQGAMESLGALYCPCTFNTRYGTSAAEDINELTQVVGWSETVRGSWVHHAYLWENGTMRDIGGGAGDWSISRAFGINNLSQVVGDFARDAGLMGTSSGFDRRAFLWQDGVMQDLGTLSGHTSSTALGINDDAQVVGWSGAPDASVSRAFLWMNGVVLDLGTLPGDDNSQALGINGGAQVVGWSGTAKRSASRAFLWQFGLMLDLNSVLPAGSGWVLTEASDINDAGQIVGTGLHDGQVRAFLLEPELSAGTIGVPLPALNAVLP